MSYAELFLQLTNNLSVVSDYIGLIGVLLVLIAYTMLQLGYLNPKDFSYSLMNLVGSIFLLVSLYFHWNFASVVIEVVWFLISIYGVYKSISLKTEKIKI
jgi:uncharacterized membrane protein